MQRLLFKKMIYKISCSFCEKSFKVFNLNWIEIVCIHCGFDIQKKYVKVRKRR
jgi:rRNA maturation endonuclease Nob1